MITTSQYIWENGIWNTKDEKTKKPQFCLIFGSRLPLESEGQNALEQLKLIYPETKFITVSTAGNVLSTQVSYNSLTATCFSFEKTEAVVKSFKIDSEQHKEIGKSAAESFDTKDLTTVLLYSTSGLNAGEFIDGVNEGFGNDIKVSGGIAGDGTRFEKTLVGVDQDIHQDNIVMVGLYSKDLQVTFGSEGGWNTFGPTRKVTKAQANVLYEIDNIPVLDLYKEYLGEKSKELPSAALLFPFAIVDDETSEFIVRGVQDINTEDKSITLFSGIKVGQSLHLMRANNPNLIEGSGVSAQKSMKDIDNPPQVAILVSCVGRRLALDQSIEDEIEEVRDILGTESKICGFYSYSEFSPLEGSSDCSIHNQTMTITTLSEN